MPQETDLYEPGFHALCLLVEFIQWEVLARDEKEEESLGNAMPLPAPGKVWAAAAFLYPCLQLHVHREPSTMPQHFSGPEDTIPFTCLF